jgi:uncharacterized 2Fe-2S/4Fe-4S cluster protein (DUF4445 family)
MPLRLITEGGEIESRHGFGRVITEMADELGLALNTRCGGKGICSGCHVLLEEGDFLVGEERVSPAPGAPVEALGCRTRVASESARIRIPPGSLVERCAKIEDDFIAGQFRHEAPSRKFFLRIPEPSLEFAEPDWVRIERELEKHSALRGVHAPAEVLKLIPAALRDGESRITVTVGRQETHWTALDIEPHDTTARHFGIAVDIGTTTVVAVLVDLNSATMLGKASMYNRQIGRADDVASRISYGRTQREVEELQHLVVQDTINPLINALCARHGVASASIYRAAIAGNTVMSHLFLGLSPEGIGRLPFQPVARAFAAQRARDVGLAMNPSGLVDVLPAISGYVGGDITADMYVARLTHDPSLTALVDIGTNGEIVVSEGNRFAACATAAGPAFEGYGISCGARAAAGAIEHIEFDRALNMKVDVIGGGLPTGICGSAIIDFIACGLRSGLLNRMGRFDLDLLRACGRHAEHAHGRGASHACVVMSAAQSGTGRAIFVSEHDVSQVLKAKAAIYAGIKTLMEHLGRPFRDIRRFCLAGGFARHIRLENAVHMGLLPAIPLDRFHIIGNGSLGGAYLALVDGDAREAFDTLARLPRTIELNRAPTFETNYVDALALPNLCDGDDAGATV